MTLRTYNANHIKVMIHAEHGKPVT